tara:strand:+ start:1182 stop:1376 length:195 start_codon:yes stop_codon:yes gene_type:complete
METMQQSPVPDSSKKGKVINISKLDSLAAGDSIISLRQDISIIQSEKEKEKPNVHFNEDNNSNS